MVEAAALDAYQRTLIDNSAAAEELVGAAGQFSAARWSTATRPGGWTPAQHVVHVTLAYRNAVADMRGGTRARLRGTHAKRLFWRALGLPQVLYLRRLPPGVESPSEFRPPKKSPPREQAIGNLRASVAEFVTAMTETRATRPDYALQHPYFEMISLRSTAILCAVHTRHHAKLLTRFAREANG
jgi:hypothetical protein